MRNQEDELRKVFRIYDDDDGGIITYTNLMRCAEDLGEDCSKDQIETMIAMGDTDMLTKMKKTGVD